MESEFFPVVMAPTAHPGAGWHTKSNAVKFAYRNMYYNLEHMLVNYEIFLIFSFLALGDSFNTLALHFQLGVSTVHKIVKDTCDAIWTALQPEYLPEPKK